MNVETLLHEEIVRELETLKEMEVGSEAYRTTVDGLTKLTDRTIEIDKLNVEHDERINAQHEENRDRLVKNCITVANIALATAVTIWGTIVSINFEKEGTITTTAGRNFFGKLFPRK